MKERDLHSLVDMVRRIAGGLAHRSSVADADDLASAGFLALVEAADRFDRDRGVPFEAFAVRRIRGAMIDHLRSTGTISRRSHDRMKAIEERRRSFRLRHGRKPTHHELAREMDMTVDDLHAVARGASRGVIHIDEAGEDGLSWERVRLPEAAPDVVQRLAFREQYGELHEAIDSLPPIEAEVVRMSFLDERSCREIAKHLSVTPAWVRKVRARALHHLRDRVRDLRAA